MKKVCFCRLIAWFSVVLMLAGCASSRCECENNYRYKQRKGRFSLINEQKNSTFVAQNEGKREM
jgi:hypothetical protein